MIDKIKGNWNNENGVSSGKAVLYKVKLIGGLLITLAGVGAGIWFVIAGAGFTSILVSLGAGVIAGVATVAAQVLGYDSDAGYNT